MAQPYGKVRRHPGPRPLELPIWTKDSIRITTTLRRVRKTPQRRSPRTASNRDLQRRRRRHRERTHALRDVRARPARDSGIPRILPLRAREPKQQRPLRPRLRPLEARRIAP